MGSVGAFFRRSAGASGCLALACVLASLVGSQPAAASAAGIDLSLYHRVGRFDLPSSTNTTPPAGSLLGDEASGVTYDPDTNSLFVIGDGATSVVQVGLDGHLIDSMTLTHSAGTGGAGFFDTEGITYVGGGQFVLMEERDRQADEFTYVPDTTLTRADVHAVKLGTTIGNIGLEGISYDPQTSGATPGFIVVKEKEPESIFQTNIDFPAGTATNGSATADEASDLFTPANAGLLDFSDVYSLANLPAGVAGPDADHLLIISQESGEIENVDRSGNVSSALFIHGDAGNPLSVPDQTDEGVTMDASGNLYVVNEDGGGTGIPQLWAYAPSTDPDQAPTGISLANQATSLRDDTAHHHTGQARRRRHRRRRPDRDEQPQRLRGRRRLVRGRPHGALPQGRHDAQRGDQVELRRDGRSRRPDRHRRHAPVRHDTVPPDRDGGPAAGVVGRHLGGRSVGQRGDAVRGRLVRDHEQRHECAGPDGLEDG